MDPRMKCDRCGALDYVLIDGYDFGDTLLEGVMFQIRVASNGKLSASIDPDHTDYFKTLNQRKWLTEAKRYAAKECDVAQCPKCKKDVGWESNQGAKRLRQFAVEIQLTRPGDLMS
jgi:hypothetical protein